MKLLLTREPHSKRFTRRRIRIAIISFTIWVACFWLWQGAGSVVNFYQYKENVGSGVSDYIAAYPNAPSINCESATAPTRAQTWFMIDAFAFKNLQFWQVKLIDVALDLVIGQLGRFVHGWLLYRYVVAAGLTLVLEASAMPYATILNLTFSPVSWWAIWDTIKSIWLQPKARPIAIQLWLVFAIGFTLAYPLLWGAATGYISPNTAVFQVPGGTFLPPMSDAIQLCYSLDTDRLSPNASKIVFGPSLQSLAIQSASIRTSLLSNSTDFPAPLNVSTDFLDILKYSLTQQMIKYALTQVWPGNTTNYNFSASQPLIDGQSNMFTLPENLSGFQFCGKDEPDCSILSSKYPSRVVAPSTVPFPWPDLKAPDFDWRDVWPAPAALEVFPPWVDTDLSVKAIELKLSETKESLDVVDTPLNHPSTYEPYYDDNAPFPYNSSLWLEGHLYNLPAPFLNYTKDCPITAYSVPVCLCYAGNPIPYSFPDAGDDDIMLGCLSDSNAYAWGVASVLTTCLVGLELIWILGCWSVWLDAEKRSVLWKYRRTRLGTARSVLDIAASMNHDLGPDTVENSERELRKKLKGLDMVGHEVDVNGTDGGTIGLLTRRQGRRNKKAKPARREART